MISLDLSNAKLDKELSLYQEKVSKAHNDLHNGTGAGNEHNKCHNERQY